MKPALDPRCELAEEVLVALAGHLPPEQPFGRPVTVVMGTGGGTAVALVEFDDGTSGWWTLHTGRAELLRTGPDGSEVAAWSLGRLLYRRSATG